MTDFTVTTTADIVNPNDGVLSLREALSASQAVDGIATVVFDPIAFTGESGFPIPIELDSRLEIGNGTQVVIDGSLSMPGEFDNVHILLGDNVDRLFTVEAGAHVTMRDLVLGGGSVNEVTGAGGYAGLDGDSGASGAKGINRGDRGEDGMDGAVGAGAPDEDENEMEGDPGVGGSDGAMAIGGILNEGTLILEQVFFNAIGAAGGDGGRGGEGGLELENYTTVVSEGGSHTCKHVLPRNG
jgi:CSLREA domain-containing protein